MASASSLSEPSMAEILSSFLHLPRFADGRINYTDAETSPVLVCFVRYQDKYLLLKRSDKVGLYKGYWSAIAGFIDNEKQTLREKVLEELDEEAGITEEQIVGWTWIEEYEYSDPVTGKKFIRYPVVVDFLHRPEITLDWEHHKHEWICAEERQNYQQITGSEESWKRVLEKRIRSGEWRVVGSGKG